MPGVPNEHLPGRGITDLTSRGRYNDDVASFKKGLRESRALLERLLLLEREDESGLWSVTETGVDLQAQGGNLRVRCHTTGGNITLTLPPSSGLDGQQISIIKVTVDANTVTIAPNGTDFLGVVAGREILSAQWEYLTLVCINQNGNNGWDAV